MKLTKPVIILGGLLFLSLMGNVFMGGVMAGKAYQQPRHASWMKKDAVLREKLSDADRHILRAAKKEHHEQFRTLRAALESARDNVHAAMDVDNQGALDAALKEEKDAKKNLLRTMRKSRKEMMKELSPEGRKVLKELRGRRKSGKRHYRHRRSRD